MNDPANLNGKLFAYELKYHNPVYSTVSTGKYNGNIAEIDWQAADGGTLRRYNYQYDVLDRLKNGIYSEPNATVPQNNYFNETLTYDLGGNIQTLKRNRLLSNVGAVVMDNLGYTYAGNRLNTVTDSSGNYGGYPDISGNPIPYDGNGNMSSHIDRGILQIDYNYLNLPNYVKFDQNYVPHDLEVNTYVNTKYLYNAAGAKLKKVYTYGSGRMNVKTVETTDYLDGFQYINDVLSFVPTSEGYYDFVQNKYIYNYTDHQGNIRLAYYKDASGNLKIDRTTHFYPFGLEFGGELSTAVSITPSYKYSTQGQEKQSETGWSSYRWRNYDSAMGRFFNVDPLSEKYAYQSHYNFSENRVIDGRELEGLEWIGVVTRAMPSFENSSFRPSPVIETVNKTIEIGEGTIKTSRFSKEQLANFDRGRRIELEQINKMNEEGQSVSRNTKNYEAIDPKTGKTGQTRPDGFTKDGRPVEVKNVKKQGLTRQLRFQDNLSEGKRLILRINNKAELTKPLKESGIDIQPYNLSTPVKIDNIKVNSNPPAKVNPQPQKNDKCAKDPNCV